MKAKVIGLTGQTGAGKTTVGAVLRRKGFDVIDCDIVSRDVVRPGMPALAKLAARFGGSILHADGSLNRKKLGELVFGNPPELAALGQITYPHIMAELQKRMNEIDTGHTNGIVLDAPTLFESGADSICDVVIAVLAPEPLRFARILERDNLTQTAAAARIASQHDDEYYSARARYVLRNTADPAQLERLAAELAAELTCG